MQKSIQIVLQKIEEVWWAKVLVAILLAIPLLIFWPFTIGGALAYLAFKYIANQKIKWTLVTLILIPTFFIGSAWVVGVFTPRSLYLDLDTVPPTNQSQATISGKTLSGKLVEVLKEGQVVAETTADEARRFRIEVKDLAEGENQFVVRVCEEKKEQEDAAQCIEKTITILVDKTPPLSPLIKDYPAMSESDQVTIKGIAEKGAKVKIFISEEEKAVVEAGQDRTFEANVPLSEGENKIKAQAIDQAGNVSKFSKAVVITYQPPPPSEEVEPEQPPQPEPEQPTPPPEEQEEEDQELLSYKIRHRQSKFGDIFLIEGEFTDFVTVGEDADSVFRKLGKSDGEPVVEQDPEFEMLIEHRYGDDYLLFAREPEKKAYYILWDVY